MTSPSRDVFSYAGVRTSSVVLRRGRSRGSTYGVASLEGEGLPVRPTLRVQSYLMTHLVPVRLIPPLPQHLPSADLLLEERLPSGEAPVPEGLAVHEVPPVPKGLELPEEIVSCFKSLSLSDTIVQVHE